MIKIYDQFVTNISIDRHTIRAHGARAVPDDSGESGAAAAAGRQARAAVAQDQGAEPPLRQRRQAAQAERRHTDQQGDPHHIRRRRVRGLQELNHDGGRRPRGLHQPPPPVARLKPLPGLQGSSSSQTFHEEGVLEIHLNGIIVV